MHVTALAECGRRHCEERSDEATQGLRRDVEPIAGGEYDVIETSRAAAVEFDFHAAAPGDVAS
jgi:hypothetical protein